VYTDLAWISTGGFAVCLQFTATEVLGLDPYYTESEVQAAWRIASVRLHPGTSRKRFLLAAATWAP
jgi:hypothetical protein